MKSDEVCFGQDETVRLRYRVPAVGVGAVSQLQCCPRKERTGSLVMRAAHARSWTCAGGSTGWYKHSRKAGTFGIGAPCLMRCHWRQGLPRSAEAQSRSNSTLPSVRGRRDVHPLGIDSNRDNTSGSNSVRTVADCSRNGAQRQ